MTGPWAEANAALLGARGLVALPEQDARDLLALLHAGTLVEMADAAAMRALDLERLRQWRALAAGILPPDEAERAAMHLLALGHREPARARLASAPSAGLTDAWAAWVGAGQGGSEDAALVLAGLRLVPAAHVGEVAIEVLDPLPPHVGVRRLRVGGTVLDVLLRRRPAGFTVRVARTHGPTLVATVRLPSRAGLVTVDDVDGLASPLRFELRDRHEVVAYG